MHIQPTSPSPTPYAPGNIDVIIDALSPDGLAELCRIFLHGRFGAKDSLQWLRGSVRYGFEREIIPGEAIVETYADECTFACPSCGIMIGLYDTLPCELECGYQCGVRS